MGSALPGRASANTAVALTQVALRLFQLGDLADAIGDLTGLGRANVDSLVQKAQAELAHHAAAEFTAVPLADRQWAESIVKRAYVQLAVDPARRVMGDSLIGPAAVVRLAQEALSAEDAREITEASDGAQSYLRALSESIAYLISEWYSTNEESNRAAMAQAAGETLHTVRGISDLIEALKAHLDSLFADAPTRLEREVTIHSGSDVECETGPAHKSIVFELDLSFEPLATDEEFARLVTAASVAAVEHTPVRIEVSLPTLDDDLKAMTDAVRMAQLKRQFWDRAGRILRVLTAFFSPQVEAQWAADLSGVPDRVSVVRSVLAGPQGNVTGLSKLDVWRTTPPLASAPVWLTAEEVDAVVKSARLTHWGQLRFGPGMRAADELPDSLIVGKVIPNILWALVSREVTDEVDWPADVLFLPSWHIGQG